MTTILKSRNYISPSCPALAGCAIEMTSAFLDYNRRQRLLQTCSFMCDGFEGRFEPLPIE